jgi:hypothetical protein
MSEKQRKLDEYLTALKNRPQKTKRASSSLSREDKQKIAKQKSADRQKYRRIRQNAIQLANEIESVQQATITNENIGEIEDNLILRNSQEIEFFEVGYTSPEHEIMIENNFSANGENYVFDTCNNFINNNNNNQITEEFVQLDISKDPFTSLSHENGYKAAFGQTKVRENIARYLSDTSFPADSPFQQFLEINDTNNHPKLYKSLTTGQNVWLNAKIVELFQSHEPRSFDIQGWSFWKYLNIAKGLKKMELGSQAKQS